MAANGSYLATALYAMLYTWDITQTDNFMKELRAIRGTPLQEVTAIKKLTKDTFKELWTGVLTKGGGGGAPAVTETKESEKTLSPIEKDKEETRKQLLEQVTNIFTQIRTNILNTKDMVQTIQNKVTAPQYALYFHNFAEIVKNNQELRDHLLKTYPPDKLPPNFAWTSKQKETAQCKETFVKSDDVNIIIQAPGVTIDKNISRNGYQIAYNADGKPNQASFYYRVVLHLWVIRSAIAYLSKEEWDKAQTYDQLYGQIYTDTGAARRQNTQKDGYQDIFQQILNLPGETVESLKFVQSQILTQTLEKIESDETYFNSEKGVYNTDLIYHTLIRPIQKKFEDFSKDDFGNVGDTIEHLGLFSDKPIPLASIISDEKTHVQLQTKFFHALSLANQLADDVTNDDIRNRLFSEWPIEYFKTRPGQVFTI
jgi:hypothetical protein